MKTDYDIRYVLWGTLIFVVLWIVSFFVSPGAMLLLIFGGMGLGALVAIYPLLKVVFGKKREVNEKRKNRAWYPVIGLFTLLLTWISQLFLSKNPALWVFMGGYGITLIIFLWPWFETWLKNKNDNSNPGGEG